MEKVLDGVGNGERCGWLPTPDEGGHNTKHVLCSDNNQGWDTAGNSLDANVKVTFDLGSAQPMDFVEVSLWEWELDGGFWKLDACTSSEDSSCTNVVSEMVTTATQLVLWSPGMGSCATLFESDRRRRLVFRTRTVACCRRGRALQEFILCTLVNS